MTALSSAPLSFSYYLVYRQSGQFFAGKVYIVGGVNAQLTYLIYGLSICFPYQDNTGKNPV